MIPKITPKPKKTGSIFIRFRLTQDGKQKSYEMTLPLKWDDRRDRRKAEEIADIIRQDIKHDILGLQPTAFDPTLQKYRPGLKIAVAPKIPSLLDVWVKFVDFKTQEGKIQETTLTKDYPYIEKMLTSVDPDLLRLSNSKQLLSCLTKRYKPSTLVFQYIRISACANWAVKQDIWEKNPYSRDLAILKGQCENSDKSGKAYSDSEAVAILNTIATDRFTSPHARIKHSYYAEFLKFMFLTGVRPQLAIALEWEQIIWDGDRPIKIYFDRAYSGMSEETIAALLDTSPEMIRKHYRDDRRYYENLAQNITLPELGD